MKRIIKFGILLILCAISYLVGWGNGQASAYDKMENAPSLNELYSK